eukprot:TRINITY_DN84442_c0_g1_i1.p1 TRINITY_DN84442_c0_g1~~TRINITY_DN84442_c0_g1_i1.p1  ORF type:complete len:355 (-),score=29.35 TRINITY_DN84442_c0_g1_i1:219-1283(-)
MGRMLRSGTLFASSRPSGFGGGPLPHIGETELNGVTMQVYRTPAQHIMRAFASYFPISLSIDMYINYNANPSNAGNSFWGLKINKLEAVRFCDGACWKQLDDYGSSPLTAHHPSYDNPYTSPHDAMCDVQANNQGHVVAVHYVGPQPAPPGAEYNVQGMNWVHTLYNPGAGVSLWVMYHNCDTTGPGLLGSTSVPHTIAVIPQQGYGTEFTAVGLFTADGQPQTVGADDGIVPLPEHEYIIIKLTFWFIGQFNDGFGRLFVDGVQVWETAHDSSQNTVPIRGTYPLGGSALWQDAPPSDPAPNGHPVEVEVVVDPHTSLELSLTASASCGSGVAGSGACAFALVFGAVEAWGCD